MAKKSFGIIGAVNRLLKKIYVVVDGVYRKVTKIYVVVDGVYRLAWKSGANFIFVQNDTFDATAYYTDDGIAFETIGTTSFGSSSGAQGVCVAGDYLWMSGHSYIVRMSLKDGTTTQMRPLYDLIGGTSGYHNYTDIIEVNGRVIAGVNDSYSASTTKGSYVVYSDDNGATWKHSALTTSATGTSWIAYLGGYYYVLTTNRHVFYSSDLVTWDFVTVLSSSHTVYGMAVFKERLIIASKTDSKTYIGYSAVKPANTLSFTSKQVASTSIALNRPKVANNTLFIMESTYQGNVMCMSDVTSSDITQIKIGEVLDDIAYKDGVYYLGGNTLRYGSDLNNLTENSNMAGVRYIIEMGD